MEILERFIMYSQILSNNIQIQMNLDEVQPDYPQFHIRINRITFINFKQEKKNKFLLSLKILSEHD